MTSQRDQVEVKGHVTFEDRIDVWVDVDNVPGMHGSPTRTLQRQNIDTSEDNDQNVGVLSTHFVVFTENKFVA